MRPSDTIKLGWSVATVLLRAPDETTVVHSPWDQPFVSEETPQQWQQAWDYLADRVRDGSGGNFYSFEIDAFAVERLEDVTPAAPAPRGHPRRRHCDRSLRTDVKPDDRCGIFG